MPFDLVGWGEATPGAGVVKLVGLLGDELYSTSGDDIILKSDAQTLLALFGAFTSTGGEIMIRQPSLYIDHRFLKSCLSEDVDAIQGLNMCLRGLPLKGGEKCNALVQNGTDELGMIGAFIGSAPITRQMIDQVRPTHNICGKSDTTQVAYTWTKNVMTWEEDLEEGTYAIVGMKASVFKAANTHLALARLLLPSATNWRPGVVASVAEADHEESQSITEQPFSKWPFMREIIFKSNSPPSIETASPTAATDLNVELQLVKIA